jgi:hypothetical protein
MYLVLAPTLSSCIPPEALTHEHRAYPRLNPLRPILLSLSSSFFHSTTMEAPWMRVSLAQFFVPISLRKSCLILIQDCMGDQLIELERKGDSINRDTCSTQKLKSPLCKHTSSIDYASTSPSLTRRRLRPLISF